MIALQTSLLLFMALHDWVDLPPFTDLQARKPCDPKYPSCYHSFSGLDLFGTLNLRVAMTKDGKKRCFGGQPGKEFYTEYHDHEWGVPSHDDKHLFEMLILEGAQAGLSWETILKRREGYRKAFHHFDPKKVAKMTDDQLEGLLHNENIIRNRLKVFAARKNAQIFLKIQQEFGSFDRYLWNFVGGKPIVNYRKSFASVPATNPESDVLSKDLKKRGMSFVGSTIIYAFMQAVGLVNDHLEGCFRSLI